MAEQAVNEELSPQPNWVKPVLRLAGIYNLLWGGWVIFFPMVSLRVCGYPETPVYPQLWQCIGMIVGVYGIGYWIAANDAYRHWPIVLVGFLGKIFGPLGMLQNLIAGDLPLSAGRTIILNDLIWWIPFGMILWQAFRHHHVVQTTSAEEMSFADALKSFRDQHNTSLAELSDDQSVLVLFLRHGGCTFCREAMADLSAKREQIEAAGIRIAVVHMESEERANNFFSKYALEDVSQIRDPQQVLYRAFGIGLGRLDQLMSRRVLWRGFKTAILDRHGFSKVEGNVLRMPGTFLIENRAIIKAHEYRDASDRPDYSQFACDVNRDCEAERSMAPYDQLNDPMTSSSGI